MSAPVVTSHARVPIAMLRPETIEFLSSAFWTIHECKWCGIRKWVAS